MPHLEIIRLAVGETAGPIHVGQMPRHCARYLGVPTTWVKLSIYNLTKQMAHHGDFTMDSFEDIPWILENGEIIHDLKPNYLHFVGDTRPACGHRTKVTVKATGGQSEAFMVSAFRLRQPDYERIKRKAARRK